MTGTATFYVIFVHCKGISSAIKLSITCISFLTLFVDGNLVGEGDANANESLFIFLPPWHTPIHPSSRAVFRLIYGWPFVSKLWHDIRAVFSHVYLQSFLLHDIRAFFCHVYLRFIPKYMTIFLRAYICAQKNPYTAISRKVAGKNVHATIARGNMGYDRFTVPDTVAVEPTFVTFL